MLQKCKQCGKDFVISESEIAFFKSKNLNIPKRCPECRNSNKSRSQNSSSNTSNRSDNYHAARGMNSYNSTRKSIKNVLVKFFILFIVLTGIYSLYTRESKVLKKDTSYSNDYYDDNAGNANTLRFRNSNLLSQHYYKHGKEMGFYNEKDYERAAAKVYDNPSKVCKLEKEDNDKVCYVESTNEFIVISTDGYIRTYFYPNDGVRYYNRQ